MKEERLIKQLVKFGTFHVQCVLLTVTKWVFWQNGMIYALSNY